MKTNVIEMLKGRGWVSERELCQMAAAKAHLVRPVTTKLFIRRLVDIRVGGEGRSFRLNKAGRKHATMRVVSTFPPPSWKLGN